MNFTHITNLVRKDIMSHPYKTQEGISGLENWTMLFQIYLIALI